MNASLNGRSTMRAEELLARDAMFLWHPWSPTRATPETIIPVAGSGCEVTDADGVTYLDAKSSGLNATLGYGCQPVIRAAARQARTLMTYDLGEGSNAPAIALAEAIASRTPAGLTRTFFCNSGSEAGLLAAGGYATATYVWFSVCQSGWMAVGALVKDLPDVVGDAHAGRATLAVTRGPAATLRTAVFCSLGIALTLVFGASLTSGLTLSAAVVVVGSFLLVVVAVMWHRIASAQRALPYHVFMWTQYAAHAVAL